VLVNRIAEEMFGYVRDELMGQSVDLLVPDAIRHQHYRHRDSYLEHPRTRPMGTAWNCTPAAATGRFSRRDQPQPHPDGKRYACDGGDSRRDRT